MNLLIHFESHSICCFDSALPLENVFYCLVVSWHGAEDQLPDGSACLLVPNITGSPTFVTFDTSDAQNLTKLGLLAEARHCFCASLRTCSHLSSIFDSPKFLMVIYTPYHHSFDDLSMSTTRSWVFANHIYLRAGKLISPFTNSSSFVAKRGPGA